MSSRARPDSEQGSRALAAPLGLASVAAVLFVVGGVVPAVADSQRGFVSAPLLIVLALVPPAAAALLVRRGKVNAAAGVLAGVAVLGPGRVLLDLQLAVDPNAAARPELYLPTDLMPHSASFGLWLLPVGHVLAVVAGVLAVGVARSRADIADAGERATSDEAFSEWRTRRLLPVVLAAVVAAFGLLMAPFASHDVYLLARNAFEGPFVAMAGFLIIACLLPLGAALCMTSGHGVFARAGLVGLAFGAVTLAAPNLAAAIAIPALDVSAGPIVVIVAAAAVAVMAWLGASRDAADVTGGDDAERDATARPTAVPGPRRLRIATGVLAALTAVAAVLGAVTAQLTVSASSGSVPSVEGMTSAVSVPESPARWLLLSAGVLVGVAGLGLFVPRLASVVRPALSVVWVGVLLAGTAVLDTALTATRLPSGLLSAGPGVLWTWLAMFGAVVAACCSVATGFVEREDGSDTDDTDEDATDADPAGSAQRPGLGVLASVVATALLAVAAFGSPVLTAPGYATPGLWANFGTPSWGLVAALVTVLGASAVAVRARPVPGAALLAGVACVLGLHAATLPLTDLDGAGASVGLWLALAGAVTALVGAGFAAAGLRRPSTV